MLFGGATGGIIGMNVFRHKTLKKISVGIPILFVLQLILNSFILGFWDFGRFSKRTGISKKVYDIIKIRICRKGKIRQWN